MDPEENLEEYSLRIDREGRPSFRVGQIVRLRNGEKPQRVVAVTHRRSGRQWIEYVQAEYLTNYVRQYPATPRPASDYVLLGENAVKIETQPKEGSEVSKLYQTKDGKQFGTLLARNSAGKLVLEMKGEGARIEAFDEDAVEIVRPYTVRLKNLATGSTIDFVTKKGAVEVGNLALVAQCLYCVIAVDTKVEATSVLRGSVFEGTAIEAAAEPI